MKRRKSALPLTLFGLSLLALVTTSAFAASPLDENIFLAVLPMNAEDADALVHQLEAKGLEKEWGAHVHEYLLLAENLNSIPLFLPAQKGALCLASAMRYDIDKAMKLSPEQDAATRQAITTFLLAHEVSHCRQFLPLKAREGQGEALPALADYPLWLEETLADHRARLAVQPLGKAGQNAIVAWERYRLFGFLDGDLDHWTTPLIHRLGETTAVDSTAVTLAASGMGGDASYQAITPGWQRLRKAIFIGDDGSPEQMQAWNSGVNSLPEEMRPALPSLTELRALTKGIWPEASDWRLKAISRVRPPRT